MANKYTVSLSDFYEQLAEGLSKSGIYTAKVLSDISFAILKKRNNMKMTQSEFSIFMGVTQGMVSKWEKGDYNFTIETIANICEKLQMTFDIVMEDEDKEGRVSYKTREYHVSNINWSIEEFPVQDINTILEAS